jgi:hypothetical protein
MFSEGYLYYAGKNMYEVQSKVLSTMYHVPCLGQAGKSRERRIKIKEPRLGKPADSRGLPASGRLALPTSFFIIRSSTFDIKKSSK